MKKNTNSKNSSRMVINNNINGDFAINRKGDHFSLQVEGNTKTGDFNFSADIEEGQISYQGTEKGAEQIRQFMMEEEDRLAKRRIKEKEDWQEFKKDLKAFAGMIPFILEAIRGEVNKMDDWKDQRSSKRAEKRGMAYIEKAKLDQLIQELNELRAQQGKKTTEETTDDFEKVR